MSCKGPLRFLLKGKGFFLYIVNVINIYIRKVITAINMEHFGSYLITKKNMRRILKGCDHPSDGIERYVVFNNVHFYICKAVLSKKTKQKNNCGNYKYI